jgi:hypothetical protein
MGQVLAPLEDLKLQDLPEKCRANWTLTGPGAILVGLSIGAGEIIIWPRVVAEYGATMAWAAVVGVFLQLWINLEIGRWTVSTGETIYTGFARVWRGFAPLFILLTILGWLAPGWGRASGLALKALLVGPTWHLQPDADGRLVPTDFLGSDTFWTIVTFTIVGFVLFGHKLVYKSVEITVSSLVVIITLGLLLVAFNVGTASTWKELGKGLLNVGYVDPRLSVKDFFINLVFAGAGGTANLFYCFYLRDKHIGMAQNVPTMLNPLRGRTEKIPATGFRFPDTPENRRRFREWFGFILQDQTLYFWGLNSLTILLFIFGALAVLHPQRIVPTAGSLIWDEAQILGQIWGGTGRTIFLLVGVATLFSTQLALVDGVSRSIADIVYTNFAAARKRDVGWWYVAIAISWMIVGCAITWIMERQKVSELGFLFSASYMGGFAMAVYTPLTLYVNLRYLPRAARPGALCIVMMVVASVVYVGFASACIYWEISRRVGG